MKLIALSSPVAGREEEYNDWYDNVHFPDVLKVAGVKNAQRYRTINPAVNSMTHSYVAIYEIDAPLDDFLTAMGAAASSMVMTDANDNANALMGFFELVTEVSN